MLVLVMDDLDQLVPGALDPEEGGEVLQVTEPVVQPGDSEVGQADVGTDTVGSILLHS